MRTRGPIRSDAAGRQEDCIPFSARCRVLSGGQIRCCLFNTLKFLNANAASPVPVFLAELKDSFPQHYVMAFLGLATGLRPSSSTAASTERRSGRCPARRGQAAGAALADDRRDGTQRDEADDSVRHRGAGGGHPRCCAGTSRLGSRRRSNAGLRPAVPSSHGRLPGADGARGAVRGGLRGDRAGTTPSPTRHAQDVQRPDARRPGGGHRHA